MKILYFLLNILPFTVAHDFTVCSKNNLLDIKTVSLNPDPPVIGENLQINIIGNALGDFNPTSTVFKAKVFGVNIYDENIDLCSYITCPVKNNEEVNITINQEIPNKIPAGVTVGINIESKDNNKEITCIDLNISLKDNTINLK